MSGYTFLTATRGRIAGRIVGDQHDHIAVVVMGSHLVAVRRDGRQYVVWTWGVNTDDTISVYWGHYFDAGNYPSESAAFDAAVAYLRDTEKEP